MQLLQDNCQNECSLVMEEVELVRTASLLPLPAAAPSSLISDIMRASEGAAEPHPSAFHQKTSVIAPYIPPGAAAEAASMATMQLSLFASHAERNMADSTQTGDSPSSP